jgi:hypothetical protein
MELDSEDSQLTVRSIKEYLLRVTQAIPRNMRKNMSKSVGNKKEAMMASKLVFRVSKELRAFVGVTR